jgi:restriction endonuclease Mrr
MGCPDFNCIKATALQFCADGKAHRISEVFQVLASEFKLAEQDFEIKRVDSDYFEEG